LGGLIVLDIAVADELLVTLLLLLFLLLVVQIAKSLLLH